MDRMPAQKISSQNAASTSESTIHNTANDGRLIPRLGSPKYTSSTNTSGGSARNASAKSTITTFIDRARKARITASARPAQMPVKTTAAAISICTPTPFMIAGKYLWISSHLKNASRKAEWNSIVGSACNIGDESAGARSFRLGEDLLGRPFLPDGAVIEKDHAVGGVPRKPHLMAHHEHRHAAAFELAHHIEHAADELGSERGGGFVEQHQLRLERERPRDRDPLLLPAGKLRRIRGRFFRKSDAGERGTRQAHRALPPCAVGAGPSPAPEQRFRAPSYADKD